MNEWDRWTLPYDLLALRPTNLDKKPWQSMNSDENEIKYEIKRKYEIINVKVEVN